MTREKWDSIIDNIKTNFKVAESSNNHSEKEGGIDIEYIIFTGPLGLMKLEYITRPVIEDKKVLYSNRIGSESKVEYIYSKNEKSSKMKAYKWDEERDDWIEIEARNYS